MQPAAPGPGRHKAVQHDLAWDARIYATAPHATASVCRFQGDARRSLQFRNGAETTFPGGAGGPGERLARSHAAEIARWRTPGSAAGFGVVCLSTYMAA